MRETVGHIFVAELIDQLGCTGNIAIQVYLGILYEVFNFIGRRRTVRLSRTTLDDDEVRSRFLVLFVDTDSCCNK